MLRPATATQLGDVKRPRSPQRCSTLDKTGAANCDFTNPVGHISRRAAERHPVLEAIWHLCTSRQFENVARKRTPITIRRAYRGAKRIHRFVLNRSSPAHETDQSHALMCHENDTKAAKMS